MKNVLIIFSSVLILLSCRKDTGKLPVSLPTLPEPEESFVCEKRDTDTKGFPPEPPQGYSFANKYGNESILRVIYDRADKNVIFYTTLESSNTNYLYKYDRRTGIKKLLDQEVLNTITVHKNGWLAYEKYDKNIYKIKTNGDSLTRLTTAGTYLYPTWSHDGEFIYVYKDNLPGGIFKLNKSGTVLDTLEYISPIASRVFLTKESIYYFVLNGTERTIVERKLNTGAERVILSNKNTLGWEFICFYTDIDCSFLYWYGKDGLAKTSLSTLQSQKLFTSNYGTNYFTMFYDLSPFTNRILTAQSHREFVQPETILSSSSILELTEDGTCLRKVSVPD